MKLLLPSPGRKINARGLGGYWSGETTVNNFSVRFNNKLIELTNGWLISSKSYFKQLLDDTLRVIK